MLNLWQVIHQFSISNKCINCYFQIFMFCLPIFNKICILHSWFHRLHEQIQSLCINKHLSRTNKAIICFYRPHFRVLTIAATKCLDWKKSIIIFHPYFIAIRGCTSIILTFIIKQAYKIHSLAFNTFWNILCFRQYHVNEISCPALLWNLLFVSSVLSVYSQKND